MKKLFVVIFKFFKNKHKHKIIKISIMKQS